MSTRNLSGGSTPSNLGGSLTRINSVANAVTTLKRLFSREDRPDGAHTSDTKPPGKIPPSSSAASLQVRPPGTFL